MAGYTTACDDKCGCGLRGCERLQHEAACNSAEHKFLAGSGCNQLVPDDCAGKQIDLGDAVLVAQCQAQLGPLVTTTIGTALLAWLAWVPLLWRLVPVGTE